MLSIALSHTQLILDAGMHQKQDISRAISNVKKRNAFNLFISLLQNSMKYSSYVHNCIFYAFDFIVKSRGNIVLIWLNNI